jgi:hypothetical protein
VQIYKNKAFARFARKEGITDETLCEVVQAADSGKIDADLGGGVIKQRIARPNEGKSGGYRSILLFRKAHRAIFVFGFPKSDQDNISKDEEKAFKKIADIMLNLPDGEIAKQVQANHLIEVKCHDNQKLPK